MAACSVADHEKPGGLAGGQRRDRPGVEPGQGAVQVGERCAVREQQAGGDDHGKGGRAQHEGRALRRK